MDVAFVGHQESCSDLDSAGPEHEGGCGSATVEDSAGGEHGDVERVDYLGHESHRVVVADVSSGFGAFGNDCVSPALLHLERVGH